MKDEFIGTALFDLVRTILLRGGRVGVLRYLPQQLIDLPICELFGSVQRNKCIGSALHTDDCVYIIDRGSEQDCAGS